MAVYNVLLLLDRISFAAVKRTAESLHAVQQPRRLIERIDQQK